ncbi:GNAT family N-acetyltransferase [Paraburkholderia sp. GAS334]|jgi:putative acetyltransferase|uniref:GNAT family N-acetyltransferase n=1 Tax=Paraburkholderia sp. GAS334 TaxID=3035131 RepID=UPI003D19444A
MTERDAAFQAVKQGSSTPFELTLRPLHPDDAPQLHALRLCPGVVRFNPSKPFPTLQETRDWIAKIASPTMAIVATVGDTLVGGAELTPASLRRAHSGGIGISVHDDWQGKGVGTRLMAELIDAADNWYGLRRLELNVFADNDRAIGLYRKFGFEHEATFRGSVLRDGELIDCHFMGRLREPMPYASPSV